MRAGWLAGSLQRPSTPFLRRPDETMNRREKANLPAALSLSPSLPLALSPSLLINSKIISESFKNHTDTPDGCPMIRTPFLCPVDVQGSVKRFEEEEEQEEEETGRELNANGGGSETQTNSPAAVQSCVRGSGKSRLRY